MTTAEQYRKVAPAATRSTPHEVLIAGVPWPTYKLIALLLGVLTLTAILVGTSSADAAVLTAAAVTTVVWVLGGVLQHRR